LQTQRGSAKKIISFLVGYQWTIANGSKA
jgi:hypothetical protein